MVNHNLNLEQLLEKIGTMAETEKDRITFGAIIDAIGTRSIGPLLLAPGLILTSPLSGIPGVPTLMGIFLLLISAQLPFKKQSYWMPQLLLKRSFKKKSVSKAVSKIRPAAKFVDRFIQPRLTFLVRGISKYIIASICFITGLCIPVMEIVPFSASGAGAVITLYGLSLVAYDGFIALTAYILTGFILAIALCNLF
ncbi:MAG: exopolysaccharide biosynthesis protein [Thermodesulfobacteriota bacterium]